MKGVKKFKDRLKKDISSCELKNIYEDEQIFASIAIQVASIRQQEGLSQSELAKLVNTTQQTVSRLESPGNRSYSVKTLAKVAHALHKRLEIRLV